MSETSLLPPRPLSESQRRVLGVLIEKSLTTPDAYPMTINAIVSGCNQKSNRSPVVSYEAEDVEITLDELNRSDLVNVVISDSGRVERYRQLSRVVFGWNESQVAIMAELLLRGRQQLGELRSRASRMRQIDSLDALRTELTTLSAAGYVRSSGPLERRGVEVDHELYGDGAPALDPLPAAPSASRSTMPSIAAAAVPEQPASDHLRDEVNELRNEVDSLRSELKSLSDRLDSVL